MDDFQKRFFPAREVTRAQARGLPVVALESAAITHGPPRSQNLALAQEMENAIRVEGAVPATIGMLDGKLIIGMSQSELERLAYADGALKISLRDFASAFLRRANGGTTVAATMLVAHRLDIKVLAASAIGGVHPEHRFDVSADLTALSKIPMIVVCAGVKPGLDLSATLEYLETIGTPVIGYQTDSFPGLSSTSKNLPVSARLDDPMDIVKFAYFHWQVGMKSAVLVCQGTPSTNVRLAAQIARAMADFQRLLASAREYPSDAE
jgi:pseudouridylate synthase